MKLIVNGLLIDPGSQREGEFDILIEGDRISDIQARGSFSALKGAEVIEAQGLWVVPGLIDMHVHLREPGFEWKETIESGSKAGIRGGYTTLCCMANTRPVNDCAEITKFIKDRAKTVNAARVFPIGAVSIGLQGKEMSPFSELREAGCVAFSDDGEPVYNAGLMRRALEWCHMLDATICCHEEDKSLTCGGSMNDSSLSLKMGLKGMPKVGEEVLIARDIELARTFDAKIHICHVSTARGVELIRRAKNDHIKISAEVTPHHLFLTQERVGDYDTNAKMSPPLREEEDLEALREGLKDGTIDAIASDHAPHEKDSKEVEFDKATFGIIGLQTNLPLSLRLYTQGSLSKMRLVDALSYQAARILGLKEQGSLIKGGIADITIIDPKHVWSFTQEENKSLSQNSPFLGEAFLGEPMHGIARMVMVGGVSKL